MGATGHGQPPGMGVTGKSRSGKRNGTLWGPVGRSCGIEPSRRRLGARIAVGERRTYGYGEPLAESVPVLHPGHLQEVSPWASAVSA